MIPSSRSASPISLCFTSESISSARWRNRMPSDVNTHDPPVRSSSSTSNLPFQSDISTTPRRVAARSLSALRARAGTRKRASPPRALCPTTSWRFPQTSSTGTVPRQAAGSATWPLAFLARTAPTSGSSPSPRRHTTHWKRKSVSRMQKRSLSFLVHMRAPSL